MLPLPLRFRHAAVLLAGALLAALAVPFGAGSIAVAAPGDPISIVYEGQSPDFGYTKTGNVLTRTISVRNDGLDAISIDPAPLTALTAPFVFNSTTLVAGGRIAPGQTRTFTVTYTAPAAGTTSTQTINLTALDLDAAGTLPIPIVFLARSLATDRTHFEIDRTAIDFGSLTVGQAVTRRVTMTVGGIDPMQFKESAIQARDGASAPLASVRVSGSSFGAGTTYAPGSTATADITFTPTAAGTLVGTLTIIGRADNGDPEPASVTVVIPITGMVAAAPTPTPTPTPTPGGTPAPGTTPGTGTTPGNGSTTGSGTTRGSGTTSGTGAGSGGRSLASTGGNPGGALAFAGLTALGGLVLALGTARMRRRAR